MIGLIPVPPVDVIYPLFFTSRLNLMHTVVLTIPHLNPAWTMLLPISQSALLYIPSSYEVSIPSYLCGDSQ